MCLEKTNFFDFQRAVDLEILKCDDLSKHLTEKIISACLRGMPGNPTL